MKATSFSALRAVGLALPAWAACAGAPTAVPPPVTEITLTAPAAEPPPPARDVPVRASRDVVLPRDWSTLEQARLDEELSAWGRDGAIARLDEATLAELARALGSSDATSVRAAVILSCTGDPRAFEVLLQRLEARVPEGSRNQAGDVVAAAGTAVLAPAAEAMSRVEALAIGTRPHPCFLVRVECALASLAAGRDAAIPFLLDLLREGTNSAVKNANWRRVDWADERSLRLQDRIAQALSDRAGIECAYRSRGPLAAREREIVRLAQLLSGVPEPK